MSIRVVIADDHQLFLKSLSLLIGQLPDFSIVAEAMNGQELLDKMEKLPAPDLALVDVGMPVMDGLETTKAIRANYPTTKIVALSMSDSGVSIIGMFRSGASAYLLKDIHPDELEKALLEVYNTGFYNADGANRDFRKTINHSADTEKDSNITNNEIDFLNLACSDLTYKQIAASMNLSHRTIDGYRESLFLKLNVQSRTGMILEALRRNLITLH